MGIHIDCKCDNAKKVPSNLFGKVRNFHKATLFYPTSNKRQKVSDDNEVEISVDKSVDKTDPKDELYNAADRDLEHHHEKNTRELARIALELMTAAVSFEIVARIVNATLLDYQVIEEDDTSQLVTIGKLFYETTKVGKKLNDGAIVKFKARPPPFVGMDGKIMDTNSYNEDETGANHPVQNKVDQIGKILIGCYTFSPSSGCLLEILHRCPHGSLQLVDAAL